MRRTALLLGGLLLLLPIAGEGAKAPRPPADPTVQVKLRDLLGLVPQKDATELLARLKAIEERLAAIEGLLKSGAQPLPGVQPVIPPGATGTRK